MIGSSPRLSTFATLQPELDRKPTLLQNIHKRSHYQNPARHAKELTTETLTTFEITEELVKKCLLQLKTDKSSGTDVISPRILKEMSEQLHVPLNTIFKLSIDTSTLLRQWRDVIICPIYKKSEKKKYSKLQASVPYIHRLQDSGESDCSVARRTYQDEPPGL